jgi:hypothetical protein
MLARRAYVKRKLHTLEFEGCVDVLTAGLSGMKGLYICISVTSIVALKLQENCRPRKDQNKKILSLLICRWNPNSIAVTYYFESAYICDARNTNQRVD